ncbi:Clp protease ClpP [Clostridium intestinale]|uniref:ATP-dependent Clp protease proteolytic subunit n=1 Tax=Clostridium intestinale TaxID=36845 RepID=A0A7D7A3E8_9CLOT|nr:Clp protease ClpP [Clostridium intestinale]
MKIEIKGPIISDSQQWIYDWFDMPATSPKKVNDLISQALPGEDLEVIINSGGGSVFAGSEIFTSFRDHKGNVKGKIVGLAASAASVIAMGIKDLSISPTAQIMIHRASTYGEGNAEDMQKTIDMLNGIDKSIANAYILKTGIDKNTLLNMMSKETWLDAESAKELGFVNSIMFEEEFQAVASINNNGMLPDNIINKLMDEFKNTMEFKKNQNINNDLELAKAKLKITML